MTVVGCDAVVEVVGGGVTWGVGLDGTAGDRRAVSSGAT